MRANPSPLLVLALALLAACPPATAAETAGQMLARLDLVRNGKVAGETSFQVHSEPGRWRMESISRGTKGWARLVGFEESSFSEGDWHLGGPRPERFERTLRYAVMKDEWRAQFDWENGTVRSVHPDGENVLPLQAGVVDETALGLVVRLGLAKGETEWQLRVLDEDEIEENLFRVEAAERIQTGLGCLNTVRVDKIRAPGNKRYTRTWYARDFGFAPVRIEHGKQGGDRYEGRLLELKVDGKTVPRQPDC